MGGGRSGNKPLSSGASSAAFSATTVPQHGQTVKPDVSATGSVGAMRSQFDSQRKQSQTQSNTINATEVQNNVPEGQHSPLYYDTISEKQSLYNARARLAQDYAGEVTELRGKHNWSGEEVDMGMAILDNYRRMAEQRTVRPVNTIGLQYKLFCALAKLLPLRFVNFLVGQLYAK